MSPRTTRYLGLVFQMAEAIKTDANFVRIALDIPRKLRFKHKDLRDAVQTTGKSIGELYMDVFNGWPYLLLFGLRWQDLKVTPDKCSEFMDLWVEARPDEEAPLTSMGQLILEALNKSGFVRIKAEGELDEAPAEGNESPVSVD